MSKAALTKLSIEHLRGSVLPFSLGFEKHKKLTVVYGENGAGKSTICDAFEFLGKGKVSSLEGRGLGKTGSYWPSLGKAPADVAVTLESTADTCRATIGKLGVVAAPPECRPRVEVLRRSQILALIQATAADRYKAISRFVDVSGIEASEGALRQLIRDLTSKREVAIARLQENEDAIRQFWEVAGKPAGDPFGWAETESAAVGGTDTGVIAALTVLQEAYSRLTDYPTRLDAADRAVQEAQQSVLGATARARDAVTRVSEDAAEIVAVLEAARSYLLRHPSTPQCPLCESSERIVGLPQRIGDRLGVLSSLQTAQSNTGVAQQNVQRAVQGRQFLSESAGTHAREFENCRASHAWPDDIHLPSIAAPIAVSALAAWLASTAHLPGEWSRWIAEHRDKKQFIDTLKKALKTRRDNRQEQQELDISLPRLARVLELVEDERRKFTDDVLAKIAAEVGRLYEAVHPGEGINKISLELDPERRASLEIGASFCGRNTPPQAYFSDSHLDTLGLCIFLALARLGKPDETVLVLDDVLASVDEPHVERLIEMLYAEVMNFRHCVITTHYRPWKEKLRWGWLQNGQCHFVELTKWTAAEGLKMIRSVPNADRLRSLLAETPPDPQLVCAKAGVILEASLDFLTQLYECRVPRRADAHYTLGDLLPAVDSKLRQALRIDVKEAQDASGTPTYQTIALGPILDELHRIAQARNVFGCHFNTISFELLDSDALGFGQQVLRLIDAVSDPASGWPRSDKSGSYWSTSGETRRLHPLKRPH